MSEIKSWCVLFAIIELVVEVLSETPIWDLPIHLEEDSVIYITEQMKKEIVPDGIKVLKCKVCSSIYELLCSSLSYRPEERPDALEIIQVSQQMWSTN